MDYNMRSKERNEKRKKQVRTQRTILGAVIILLVVLLSIIFGSRFAYAENQQQNIKAQKYFKSITIASGDTLESIADQYINSEYRSTKQYVNEVKQMNHMLDDEIKTGDSLVIPYYGYVLEVSMN